MTTDPRIVTLNDVVQVIQQRWGRQALQTLRDASRRPGPPALSTGYPTLDEVLAGGFPRGQIVELLGAGTSGVTTLALKALAAAQKAHGLAAYIELTPTFDVEYAIACGVDVPRLLLVRPHSRNDAFDIGAELAARYSLSILVIDQTLDPLASSHRDLLKPGTLARFAALVRQSQAVVLCLARQQRGPAPGSPLQPFAALRLQLERMRWIRRRGATEGYETRVRLLKHRSPQPQSEVIVAITFDRSRRAVL